MYHTPRVYLICISARLLCIIHNGTMRTAPIDVTQSRIHVLDITHPYKLIHTTPKKNIFGI